MDIGLLTFAKKNRAPIVMTGTSPLEVGQYKLALLRLNKNKKGKNQLLLRYIAQIIKNPMWLTNLSAISIHAREFYHHYVRFSLKNNVNLITPFTYFKWNEETIEQTISSEVGWKKSSENEESWRNDCLIAIVKDYFYKYLLGFNDKDDHLSVLVRDGQIDRLEALRRIIKSWDITDKNIKIVLDQMGVNTLGMV